MRVNALVVPPFRQLLHGTAMALQARWKQLLGHAAFVLMT
jgi:hypothetical protein